MFEEFLFDLIVLNCITKLLFKKVYLVGLHYTSIYLVILQVLSLSPVCVSPAPVYRTTSGGARE